MPRSASGGKSPTPARSAHRKPVPRSRPGSVACGRSELNDVGAVILRPVDHDPVLAARRSHAHLRRSFDQSSSASRVTADVFSPSLPVAHLFCSFSFLPSLAMLCYPPGRACPNFEPFDPFDCKEVAASLTFANVEGYADHVSRNRQTEFLGAGPKHLQFSDKPLLRYHRCTCGADGERHFKR